MKLALCSVRDQAEALHTISEKSREKSMTRLLPESVGPESKGAALHLQACEELQESPAAQLACRCNLEG